jgi:hypothetical protein
MADRNQHGPEALKRIALARTHHVTKADRQASAEARLAESKRMLCGHMHNAVGAPRCFNLKLYRA